MSKGFDTLESGDDEVTFKFVNCLESSPSRAGPPWKREIVRLIKAALDHL